MGRNTTSYRYAADGRKLRATYKTFPGQHVGDDDRYTERNDSGLVRPGNGRIFVPSTVVETKTVDYVGNLIYEDNVIKKILIDGGYITFNEGNAPEYHFYIKDHLGNNRVVVHTSGEVEQVNHYYPYGGLMAESTNWNTQWYKYNGKARASESRESMYALLCRVQPRLDTVKELDRMHGLDWYDYGARWQDAAIGGRWHAMDPLCEKYYDVSPYVYCMNNPIMLVDTDGRDGIIYFRNNTITISCNVYLYGNGATKAVAAQMQNDVNKVWGGTYNIQHASKKYSVHFDINVSLYDGEEKHGNFISGRWNPFSRDNFIEVINDDKIRSQVKGDEGKWRGKGRHGQQIAEDDPAPHEVGHLLGLEDHYTDYIRPNGTPNSVPQKGWENNIMGNTVKGKVDNRNVYEILRIAWNAYDEWKKGGNDGEYKYELDF